jgi:two-component system response regulator NreC
MNDNPPSSCLMEPRPTPAGNSSSPAGQGLHQRRLVPDDAVAPPAIRLLCVDDHAVLVEGLKAFFAIDGRIQVVGRLSSAARLVEEVERLRPCAVLLDIEMPGPDAFAIAQQLCRTHRQVRVIVLSAHIKDAFISASYVSGACAYFSKSDELEDIADGIRDAMRAPTGAFLLGPKIRERCRPWDRGAPAGAAPAQTPGDTAATRPAAPLTLLGSLSSRETEVLRFIGKGFSRTQIAAQIFRSAKTIDSHQSHIMRKLGIHSRAELIRFAIREGLAQA